MPAGFTTKAGIVREALVYTKTWPSASAAAVTELLPLLSEDVDLENDQEAITPIDQSSGSIAPKTLRRSVRGPISADAVYEGLETYFVSILGWQAIRRSGTLQPELTGGGNYQHYIEMDNALDGRAWEAGSGFIAGPSPTGDGIIAGQQKLRRVTFALIKNQSIWETKSLMFQGMTFQAAPNFVTVSSQTIGYDISYFSGTNSGLSALSCDFDKLLFHDMIVRLAPFSASSELTDSDIVSPLAGVEFTIANGLEGLLTPNSGIFIEEPRRRGAYGITGRFAIPIIGGPITNLQSWNRNGTELMMTITFTGDEIGATGEFYTVKFWMPSVTLTGADIPTTGAGQLQQNYSFICARPSENPAGFPSNFKGGPLIIELLNTVDTHPLL